MIKVNVLFCIAVFISITGFGNSKNEFATRFHYYNNVGENEFESYLDSIINGNWVKPNSIQAYNIWLSNNKDELLSVENIFVKPYYYVEFAKTCEILEKWPEAYQNTDKALLWLPNKIFPSLYFKTLDIGRGIAAEHSDYITKIKYLKKMDEANFLSFNEKQLSDILIDLAQCNWNMHNYDESMYYCNKVQPLLKIQDYKKGKIKALLLMYHNAHFSTNDSTWSEYLSQALDIAKQLGDSGQFVNVYYTIGYSYYREDNQLKALEYYKKARTFEREKDKQSDLSILISMQLSYTLIDSVEAVGETSKYLIEQAAGPNKTNYLLGNAYRGRAWYFAKKGRKDSAVFYLDKAFEERQSLTEKRDASPGFYSYLYQTALMINDYERALKFLNLSSEQIRQISRQTNANELSHNRAELDYDLQRERIEKLTLENTLTKEKSKKQKILISATILLLLLGGTFMAFAQKKYNELRGSYRELFKKNLELDKLTLRLSQTEEKLQNNKNENSNGNGNGIKDEEKIYRRLKAMFEEEKIYKQPDISVTKLARKLRTNTSYLSIIINSRFEDSFKSLINKYRINEARKLLASPKYSNFSIEGIAEEVGYNSRSAFYQSFRQITGLTPSQYIENLEDANRK